VRNSGPTGAPNADFIGGCEDFREEQEVSRRRCGTAYLLSVGV